jgi:hypothetical protein
MHAQFYATDDVENRIWLRLWAERRGLAGVLAPEDEPEDWAA